VSAAARALVVVALAAATAEAAPNQRGPDAVRPWTGYVRVPRTQPAAAVSSRIVYVKKCDPGCQVHWAPTDDSRTGATSIAPMDSTRTIGRFTQTQQVWDEMMACVRATFAPFDLTVTDVAPPAGTPHFLNLVGGTGADLDPSFAGAGGVAPFNCGEVPNAITYTFDVYGPDPEQLCWTVAQEVAHAFGLEHEFLQKDPMTYIAGDLPKRFRDVDAPCGEYMPLSRCDCKATPQNSYRHIVGMFGPGAPTPPELTIEYPTEGKQTQPGFTAIATALDDVRVDKVEAFVDGVLVATALKPLVGDEFELPTTDIAQGPHTLDIVATDVQGVTQTASVSFTQGPPCTRDTVCTGAEVCVDGLCVPGPDTPGGLGSICSSNEECLSHQCADGGEAFKHCVATCDLGDAESCPDGFSCIAAGASGVCWPTPSAGCCDAGGGPAGPVLVTLGLGVLVLRRRGR
jgi:hypothetical protein